MASNDSQDMSINPDNIKQAIQHIYKDVCEGINTRIPEVVARLYSSDVLSTSQMLTVTRKQGAISRCGFLLDAFILADGCSDNSVMAFMDALEDLCEDTFQLITQTMDSMDTNLQMKMSADIEIETDDEIDPKLIKQALWHEYTDVCDSIGNKSPDFVHALFSRQVIDRKQRQKLNQTKTNEGTIRQCEDLLECVLSGEHGVVEFMTVLRDHLPEVFDAVNNTAERIKDGELEVGAGRVLENIKQHLIELYKEKHISVVQRLPGEEAFLLDTARKEHLMPIDFSAEKISTDERQVTFLRSDRRDIQYVKFDVECMDSVLTELHGGECRMVLCTALAGSGKSVFVKHLVSDFVNQEHVLDSFKAIFYIAVRDIPDIRAPLPELLGCGRNGLGYIKGDISISELLDNPTTSTKILFLIDGIDELSIPADSEVFKLVKGTLYPKSKVFVTSRPEATVLSLLAPFNPEIKVEIFGTTTQGVYSYLEQLITPTEGTDPKQEIKNLIQRCEEQMLEFKLLCVPLYLTLVGFLFNDHWNKHLSFAHFEIPDTISKLFYSIMQILLRTWVQKPGQKGQCSELHFHNSPLDNTSNLPQNMKRIMLAISEMSFEMLQEQTYSFSKHHLDKYFIDMEDIKLSGMFCFANQGEETSFFFLHKQLQEFMAAIYLCHKKFSTPSFSKMIDKTVQNPNKYTIMDTFAGIESVMYFVFGLSPQFAKEILNKLKGCVCVANAYKGVNIDYEGRLCFEADDLSVTESMREVLLCSLPVKKECKFKSPVSTVYNLCAGLTPGQIETLMEKWYGLEVYREGEQWGIQQSEEAGERECSYHGDELVLGYLNSTIHSILHNCTFPGVKSLKVYSSYIIDVSVITQMFPQLQQLVMGVEGDRELCVFVNRACTKVGRECTLTHIDIEGNSSQLSEYSVISLLQQPQLQSLRLQYTDIFPAMNTVECDILLPQLQSLEIIMREIDDNSCSLYYCGITRIIQNTPQLQQLTWGAGSKDIDPTQCRDVFTVFMRTVSGELTQLETLRLCNIIGRFQHGELVKPLDPVHIQTVCRSIQSLPTLTTLGLGWEDMIVAEDVWLENLTPLTLTPLTQIQTLIVGHRDTSDEEIADSVINTMEGYRSKYQFKFDVRKEEWYY